MAGLDAALRLGADTIVNTDGDNQYHVSCIPALLGPILERRAAMVVGARPVSTIAHFSVVKKILQKVGSRIVGIASGVSVPYATSGFRAIPWTAAMVLRTHNNYSYVLEDFFIPQAGRNNIPVVHVPIRVNRDLRPSRLIRSTPEYLWRSGDDHHPHLHHQQAATILRRHPASRSCCPVLHSERGLSGTTPAGIWSGAPCSPSSSQRFC